MAANKPKDIEEYIPDFPKDIQKILKQIRATVKKAAPEAEEMISYNMPLYKWNGMLVSFAGWKKHIGLYPTPATTGELKKKLAPYEGSKSTLKFPIDKTIPLDLITKVVKLRMKENLERAKMKALMKKNNQ
ncbi:MAG: DUF1801 domain-containing protein [Cyclobacteriaceae bacterium]